MCIYYKKALGALRMAWKKKKKTKKNFNPDWAQGQW